MADNASQDSGAGPTTYAVPRFVDNYWKQVPEARKIAQPSGLDQWIYPCVAKLPDVKVSIGETKSPVTIAGSKFKGPAVGPQAKGGKYRHQLLPLSRFRQMRRLKMKLTDRVPACTGHLQGDPYTILGNMGLPFFTSAFVVFNQAEPSISFAAQA